MRKSETILDSHRKKAEIHRHLLLFSQSNSDILAGIVCDGRSGEAVTINEWNGHMTTSESVGRIAILAPMQSELRPLVRLLSLKRSRSDDRSLFQGTFGRVEIVATTTGIGTRAAAHAAEKILASTPIQHLVVVGIAGGIGSSIDIGDLVVPKLVIDLATGVEYRPSVMGDAEAQGTLATSNKALIDQTEVARLERQGVIAVDMETAAIAARCESLGCPWSVFRAISDRAGDGSIDPAMLGLAGPDGEPNIPALMRFGLTNPKRISSLLQLGQGLRLATNAAAFGAVSVLGRMYAV